MAAITDHRDRTGRLFTGENLYSSSDAVVREVVLNSIDAIGRRRDSLPEIEAQIVMVFDRDEQTITVTDNGEGMNQDDLANLFSKVGASAAQVSDGYCQVNVNHALYGAKYPFSASRNQ